jgi:hypothetical protein
MMNENMFESKDMIFNNQSGGGIQSGGLSIKSIMMSKGISPIMSINTDKDSKNVERVSELFENLVIPLGLINGIKNMNSGYNIMDDERYIYDDDESEEDKDDIDSLYDKLLKLVEPDEKEIKNNDDEFLFLGGKKKNKSRKNKESKLSKMNSNKKSKKNMKK